MASSFNVVNLQGNKHPQQKTDKSSKTFFFLVQFRSLVQKKGGISLPSVNHQYISLPWLHDGGQNSLKLDEIMNAAVEQTTSSSHHMWDVRGATETAVQHVKINSNRKRRRKVRFLKRVREKKLKKKKVEKASVTEKFLKLLANTRGQEKRGECFCACMPSLKFPGGTYREITVV